MSDNSVLSVNTRNTLQIFYLMFASSSIFLTHLKVLYLFFMNNCCSLLFKCYIGLYCSCLQYWTGEQKITAIKHTYDHSTSNSTNIDIVVYNSNIPLCMSIHNQVYNETDFSFLEPSKLQLTARVVANLCNSTTWPLKVSVLTTDG